MKRIRFSKLLLLGIFLSSLAISLPASAEGGNIGGRPANPNPDLPRTKTIFIKTIEPGEFAKDGIEIINNTESEKTVQIYTVDSVRSSGGAFACAQAAEERKDVGSWIKLEKGEVKLPSGGKTIVKFEIEAPQDASVGEHNGCVVLQEKVDPQFQEGIALNFRTAIRVAVLIPGEIVKELKTTDIEVDSKKDSVEVTAKVKSESNVSLDAKLNVRLKGIIFGSKANQENTFPVLSGEVAEWNFEFDKPFWGGFYRAGFSASYDANTETVLGDQVASSDLTTIEGPNKIVFLWPQPYALAIEVLVLCLIILILVYIPRKILQKRTIKKSWKDYEVKKGDSLEELGQKRSTTWKRIAKVNKIKAPYVLVPGTTVKLPPLIASKKSTRSAED